MAAVLREHPDVRLPEPHPDAFEVRSSLQFFVDALDDAANEAFLAACASRGVTLKWFGRAEPVGYTSRHDSWRYVPSVDMPRTDAVLHRLYDVRLPLTFSVEECRTVARIAIDALRAVG